MKKVIYILLALVVAASCNDNKFLEEQTYVDDTNAFFKNQAAIEIALASAYSNIQYMVFGNQRGGSDHNWMLNGMGLDTFAPTGNNTHFSNWPTLTPDSGYARHYGDYMYKLANRANVVVDMIDEHPEIVYSTATMKNELRAEAVFLRAWAYRVLAGMFGCLVYDEHMTIAARYDYEMIPREEGWVLIAEDFKWAEENLPTTPRKMGTVTKAAAAHYLAETYLALGKFAEAEAAATRVIDKTDGQYELMTTRFGNRADQAVDRYGNSLAAPQGAYWDLFRSSAKTDGSFASDSNPNDPANKEAIWVAQMDYTPGQDNWPLGGSGDSWWRMHKPVLEATWAPWIPRGGKNGTRVDELNGNKTFYIFTADAVCFEKVEPKYLDKEDPKDTLDTDAPETKRWLEIKDGGTPAADPDAAGRKLAWTFGSSSTAKLDSLANRSIGNGGSADLGLYASEFIVRPAGSKLGSYWDDPNDFRGSETMIQRDYYTPSGKKWSEVKANIIARAASHDAEYAAAGKTNPYTLTSADTINVTPRFWKFSDDKHLIDGSHAYYDTDWYMLRIAETYLLRAEARLAQGNKNGAADDINVVRARAGAADVAPGKVNIDYILDERARELFGEEQRWVTLSRLSCNPNATPYISDNYSVQDATTSNTLYKRTRKYGFGYESDLTAGRRETYTDDLGATRHYPNIAPHNYVLPIPIQIIKSNKDKEIPQNPGY